MQEAQTHRAPPMPFVVTLLDLDVVLTITTEFVVAGRLPCSSPPSRSA
jgi:hypothetical protein